MADLRVLDLRERLAQAGISICGLRLHAIRATAASNALVHQAAIGCVQMWLDIAWALDHRNDETLRLQAVKSNEPAYNSVKILTIADDRCTI